MSDEKITLEEWRKLIAEREPPIRRIPVSERELFLARKDAEPCPFCGVKPALIGFLQFGCCNRHCPVQPTITPDIMRSYDEPMTLQSNLRRWNMRA